MKTNHHQILIKDYDYRLAPDRIAAFPLADRDASGLLIYKEGTIKDDCFSNVSDYLPTRSSLVLNDTKVIEARIFFQKITGGIIEIFCLQPVVPAIMEEAMVATQGAEWECLIGGASKWRPGEALTKEVNIRNSTCMVTATYVAKKEDSFLISFSWTGSYPFKEVLKEAGSIPLPPYIKRKFGKGDADRYQTVFALQPGSVAAPTAALHFTPAVFGALQKKGISPLFITLHVGAGTFKPVKADTIAGHKMHAEYFSVSCSFLQCLLGVETIVAVGTTSLRTLESLYWLGVKLLTRSAASFVPVITQWEPYEQPEPDFSYQESLQALYSYLEDGGKTTLHCHTSLLIVPGYTFRSARGLLTNFHQPRSTLLLLVAAFIGKDWEKVYSHALEKGYRFLSYGDSSLLWRKEG